MSLISMIQTGVLPESSVLSPDGRATSTLASLYVQAGHERDRILVEANSPAVASNPNLLYQHQLAVDSYVKRIALTSTLVSTAIKGFETVVKS